MSLLRWTHSGIDSRMMFANDAQESLSVYGTTYQLWREVITTRDITSLEIVVYNGKLLSWSNRRLAALRMYQALRGDIVVWTRCVVRNSQNQRFHNANTAMMACRFDSTLNMVYRGFPADEFHSIRRQRLPEAKGFRHR